MSTYTLSRSSYVVSSSPFYETLLLQEGKSWEDFDEQDLCMYFSDAHQRFITRIMELQSLARTITKEEENELRFMFESLIHAKLSLQDKHRGKS